MLRQIRDVKRDFAEITKEAAEIREAEKVSGLSHVTLPGHSVTVRLHCVSVGV